MAGCIHDHSDLANCIAYPAIKHVRLADVVRELQHRGEEEDVRASGLQGMKSDGPIFKDSFIESGGISRRRNAWAALGSLAFQFLLLLALSVVPLFHKNRPPKDEVVTYLYLPSPPAPAAAAVANTTKPRTPTQVSTQLSTPHPRVITIPRTQETPSVLAGAVGGVPGGVAGGVVGGVLGAVLRAPESAPVLAPAAPTKVRVPPHVAEGNLVHDVTPQYPPEAGRARIQGAVVLQAVIGKDGTIRDVRVKSGLPVLAQAAVNAVKQWRYRPYMLNGEPVEVDTEITINFTLSGS